MTAQIDIASERWRIAELLHGKPSDWLPHLWRGYSSATPLTVLDELHVRAARDGGVRAAYSAPVRHGKSSINGAGILRYMCTHPGEEVMLAGHSQDFIEGKSREYRDAAVRLRLRLRRDSSKLSHWELANGASLTCVGASAGGATGRGCSLLVVDDAFSGRDQAESAAERDRLFGWLLGTLLTRLSPTASALICGARWHADDLHGRLAETGEWEIHNQPAIDEHGNALWPAGGWTLDTLEKRRRLHGAYDFASQFLGSPIPRGDTLFTQPHTFTRDELKDALARGARVVLALDPAAGQLQRNDWSAVAVMALLGSGDSAQGYLMHMWRARLALPVLVQQVARLATDWGASLALVEGQGGFKGYADAIKAIAGRSLRVHVPVLKGDKYVRAQPLAAAIGDGRFRIPVERPSWTSWWLDELLTFPSAPHDDGVDAASLGFNLAALGPPQRTPTQLAATRGRIARNFWL